MTREDVASAAVLSPAPIKEWAHESEPALGDSVAVYSVLPRPSHRMALLGTRLDASPLCRECLGERPGDTLDDWPRQRPRGGE